MCSINFNVIINKIVRNKFYSYKQVKNIQQAKLFYKLYSYMNNFVNYRVGSVYFKYNGKYFLYVNDGVFYYLGKKKKYDRFLLQLDK